MWVWHYLFVCGRSVCRCVWVSVIACARCTVFYTKHTHTSLLLRAACVCLESVSEWGFKFCFFNAMHFFFCSLVHPPLTLWYLLITFDLIYITHSWPSDSLSLSLLQWHRFLFCSFCLLAMLDFSHFLSVFLYTRLSINEVVCVSVSMCGVCVIVGVCECVYLCETACCSGHILARTDWLRRAWLGWLLIVHRSTWRCHWWCPPRPCRQSWQSCRGCGSSAAARAQ